MRDINDIEQSTIRSFLWFILTNNHPYYPKMIVKDPITPIGFTSYPYRRILIKNPKIIEQKDRAVIIPKFFVKINAPI